METNASFFVFVSFMKKMEKWYQMIVNVTKMITPCRNQNHWLLVNRFPTSIVTLVEQTWSVAKRGCSLVITEGS